MSIALLVARGAQAQTFAGGVLWPAVRFRVLPPLSQMELVFCSILHDELFWVYSSMQLNIL